MVSPRVKNRLRTRTCVVENRVVGSRDVVQTICVVAGSVCTDATPPPGVGGSPHPPEYVAGGGPEYINPPEYVAGGGPATPGTAAPPPPLLKRAMACFLASVSSKARSRTFGSNSMRTLDRSSISR